MLGLLGRNGQAIDLHERAMGLLPPRREVIVFGETVTGKLGNDRRTWSRTGAAELTDLQEPHSA
jgi:hypothetical protein